LTRAEPSLGWDGIRLPVCNQRQACETAASGKPAVSTEPPAGQKTASGEKPAADTQPAVGLETTASMQHHWQHHCHRCSVETRSKRGTSGQSGASHDCITCSRAVIIFTRRTGSRRVTIVGTRNSCLSATNGKHAESAKGQL
jgi:hypothetical protein